MEERESRESGGGEEGAKSRKYTEERERKEEKRVGVEERKQMEPQCEVSESREKVLSPVAALPLISETRTRRDEDTALTTETKRASQPGESETLDEKSRVESRGGPSIGEPTSK